MSVSGDRDTGRYRLVLTVGVATAAFAGVALAAAGGPVPLAVEGSGGWFARFPDSELPASPAEPAERVDRPVRSDSVGADVVGVLTEVAVLVVVGVLILLVTRSVVRAVRLVAESKLTDAPFEQAPPTGSRVLADAVDDGLKALAGGPVDDVIVACWVRLEEAAAAAGAGRRPSETPAELAVRVLASFRAPDAAVQRLLDLYRAARYSRHALGEADRAAALTALGEIRHSIQLTPSRTASP